MKLKNTLRYLRGEELITHLGARVLRLARAGAGTGRLDAGAAWTRPDRRRQLKEVAHPRHVYQNCTVLHSDAIGLVFEVQRTVSEGGTIETVVSQVLVPWAQHPPTCCVMEERT